MFRNLKFVFRNLGLSVSIRLFMNLGYEFVCFKLISELFILLKPHPNKIFKWTGIIFS